MADRKKFLLDANVFIQASHQYYDFEICPGFWTALIRGHQNQNIFSIDKIKAELLSGNDRLAKWIQDKVPSTFFKKTDDAAIIACYKDLINWVQGEKQYLPEAKADFESVADGWLVAFAKVNELVVVTHEKFSPESKKGVKIPNICQKYTVKYLDTFEMLRELGFKFRLPKHR
jgi:hypothetical protein